MKHETIEDLLKELVEGVIERNKQIDDDREELSRKTSPEFLEAMDDLKSYEDMHEAVALFTDGMPDRMSGAFIHILTMNHMASLELGRKLQELEMQVKELGRV